MTTAAINIVSIKTFMREIVLGLWHCVSLCVFFCAALGAFSCMAATPLVFARNENLPEQAVAEAIFTQAMQNLKLAVEVKAEPPARANQSNLSQQVAGEIARISSYADKNPSLIKVSPSYYSLISVVYARKNSHLRVAKVDDLIPYKVAHIRGVQHSADLVKRLPDVQLAVGSESLFKMLNANRVDAVITTEIDGKIMLQRLHFDRSIEPIAVLAQRDLFIYLNQSSQALAEPISTELTRMKNTGEIKSIIERMEFELMQASEKH